MKKFACLILLVSLLLNVSAKIKVEDIDYKSSIIKYYHSGSKVRINLKNLPNNTEKVIIAPVNSAKKPKVFIIGSRSLKVKNDGSVQFTIELENLKPGTYNTKSSEVAITLYSYYDKKLEIDEKAKLYIRPIICSAEGDQVCATVEVECHKGHRNCKNKRENRTFLNRCEMKKHEAEILHTGPCIEEE